MCRRITEKIIVTDSLVPLSSLPPSTLVTVNSNNSNKIAHSPTQITVQYKLDSITVKLITWMIYDTSVNENTKSQST